MFIEIKSRFTSKVLFYGEYKNIKAAIEAAVEARAGLWRADLSGADLSRADLPGADLRSSCLAGADFSHANLSGANFSDSFLSDADFSYANLSGAKFSGAIVSRSCFSGADLSGADLSGADLSRIRGNVSCSHELLAAIAIRFDSSLTAVAAMIAGRLVGCWEGYTSVIRRHFGEAVMRRLWQAWSQDESWGVVEKMRQYRWPEPKKADDG